MKITAKCSYALIAMTVLTDNFTRKPVKASSIAERYGIPTRFLELTLNELKSADILFKAGSFAHYSL